MSLATLWAELSLSTKSFQSGLTTAQGLAQAWGRKVGGDLRNTFFNALNPARFLQATVSAVQQAMAGIGRATDEASAAREDIDGPPLDANDEAAVRVLAERLGLPLQGLADLFRDTTAAGAEFRALVQQLVTPSDTQQVDDYWAAWRRGVAGGWVGRIGQFFKDWGESISRGAHAIVDWSGNTTGRGQAEINAQRSAEEQVRRLARERRQAETYREEEARDRRESRRERQTQDRDFTRARVRALRDRGSNLMDAARGLRPGMVTDSLAGVGGFTAGAGIAALTTNQQQLQVLQVIRSNTDVMRQAANLEMDMNRLE